ncbi:MAG: nitrous oxide-stimulated promoter family protein [Methylocystaceae bacterium]
MALSRKLEAETVDKMIKLYCRDIHNNSGQMLCPSCQKVEQYALTRIDKCPFGDQKPVCSRCQVHCYKPEMREKIKSIMRYSGPRMLTRHPLLAIRYLYRKNLKSRSTAKK